MTVEPAPAPAHESSSVLTPDPLGRERIGWWLALEPVGADAVAWSLIRVGDVAPDGPVGAGLWSDLGEVRRLAAQLPPGPTAANPKDLWQGPLVDPDAERRSARRLGQALLPDELRAEVLKADQRVVRHTVTVACRGWLAQVPWETLALDVTGRIRLVERARVAAGLSPTINAGRRQAPRPRPGAPALRIVDPGPRKVVDGLGLGPIYPGGYPTPWYDRAEPDGVLQPEGVPYGADDFGAALRADGGWSRLFYFGHALPGDADTPARAALVFSTPRGLDRFSAHAWLSRPQNWPAPARVALIACGSDDSMHIEQSGLPVAAVNAGAELLTVTRWVLPTDVPGEEPATTQLALAVDAAHDTDDPLTALGRWQVERLDAWRAHGRRVDSPLLWGALATYLVPPVRLEPAGPAPQSAPSP